MTYRLRPLDYQRAVAWIGENDDPLVADAGAIQHQPTVMLLADLMGRQPLKVAIDINQWRRQRWRDR